MYPYWSGTLSDRRQFGLHSPLGCAYFYLLWGKEQTRWSLNKISSKILFCWNSSSYNKENASVPKGADACSSTANSKKSSILVSFQNLDITVNLCCQIQGIQTHIISFWSMKPRNSQWFNTFHFHAWLANLQPPNSLSALSHFGNWRGWLYIAYTLNTFRVSAWRQGRTFCVWSFH